MFAPSRTAARLTAAARCRTCLVAVAVLTPVAPAIAESQSWSQFRGPNAAGLAEEAATIPSEFGPDQHVKWQTELPFGSSSPCIRGDRIFLTGYHPDEKKLEVLCIDRTNGEIQWRRAIEPEQIEKTHAASNPATGTPAADDQRVYVYFGSHGLLCYDHDGHEVWSKEQPIPTTRCGSGTSPVVVGDLVLLNREERAASYLLAVDGATGDEAWKHEHVFRPSMGWEGYATPVIHDGQAIVHTHEGVRAIDLTNGELVWQVNANSNGCTTPVFGDGRLYVATWNPMGEPALRPQYPSFAELLEHDGDGDGLISFQEFPGDVSLFHRPEAIDEPNVALPMRVVLGMFDGNNDKQLTDEEWAKGLSGLSAFVKEHGLLAIELGGVGDVTETHSQVLEKKAIPEVPSPLYHDGRIYIIKNGGILSCYSAESGKRLYRKRLRATGSYFASPIAVGDRIFFTSVQGEVTVIKSADQLEVIAENDLGERAHATPAIADGTIYVRTMEHLYAFGH